MLKSIHHAAIICSNYEVSKHFYTSILKLEVIAENYRKERNSYKLDLKLPDGGRLSCSLLLTHQNAQVILKPWG